MRTRIDLNCDMGESFGPYRLGYDEDIIKYISSANIACGFHAGDPDWMRKTVRLAEEHGVAIGAHPGFADLKGFGRRNMNISADEVRNEVLYQIGALTAFTSDKRLQHVKPHGAMYNMAADNIDMAISICRAVLDVDAGLILVALAGTPWINIAEKMGVRVAREAFADRALNPDGTLVPRQEPGSVIYDVDKVVRQSVKIVTEGKAMTINNQEIEVHADTICLHGDTPGAVEIAATLRSRLESVGVEIVPLRMLV